MHKHRDDVAGVPFLFLTSARRPISRPSSRASNHSTLSSRLAPGRPDTPVSAPSSPLAAVFRRPHTPATSPLAGAGAHASSYMAAQAHSPSSSPTLAHAHAVAHAQFAASLPASPLSSPRLLSAKATEFRPTGAGAGAHPLTRTHSNPGSLAALRAQTPSPDLWAHHAGSPKASSLAIARPLVAEAAGLVRAATPSSSLRSSVLLGPPGADDEEDDPFDPFATAKAGGALAFGDAHAHEPDAPSWADSSTSAASSLGAEDQRLLSFGSPEQAHAIAAVLEGSDEEESEAQAVLTGGMTPFDVLSSVFGTTLAPSELEDALANNGYDFEKAMAWLVEKALPPPVAPKAAAAAAVAGQGRGGVFVGRDGPRGGRADVRGAGPPGAPRYANGRPAPGGNRVCRYFLAGECLRADCRFRWVHPFCAEGFCCGLRGGSLSPATTSNVRCAASGYVGPAPRAKTASSCTTSRQKSTSPGSRRPCRMPI
jgi:hypothetical protein